MKDIIFIAPPAAGKGTQSDMLIKNYDYLHISTGDIIREIIATGSELGQSVKNIIAKGELVSDDIMVRLIENKLGEVKGKSFILDGFPRTLNQAQVLDNMLNNLNINDYVVIYLKLDEEIATKRILGRLTCSCGKSYNIYEDALKPKLEGICDTCGKSLIKREDDNEESFKVRYQTFLKNVNPILDFYKSKNKLQEIDVNNIDLNEVFEKISEVIK